MQNSGQVKLWFIILLYSLHEVGIFYWAFIAVIFFSFGIYIYSLHAIS
jgi:hypothetical protein